MEPGSEARRGRTITCTALTLVAFALNSLLCRMALEEPAIDAASFTALRLAAGAGVLGLIALVRGRVRPAGRGGSWRSAGALVAYAIAFSFAYLELSTGTGALLLFGTVQGTMILAGVRAGERPHPREWIGAVLALGGLVYLVSPGLSAPSPTGSAVMVVAGVGWGLYALFGRGTADPVEDTTGNFLRAAPLVVVLGPLALWQGHVTGEGAILALVAGGVTTGLGYVVWYTALGGLTATRAATVQLAVPVLAAAFGALVLAESVSWRLAIAAVVILGGVRLAIGTTRPAIQEE